jgi:probable F420-dependent oxidoreductase
MMANVRPFRFSVVAESAQSPQDWLTKARRVEALGYSTLLVADHLGFSIDPIVGLMAAAAATSLRIGSHVFCNDFRHPLLLARQVADLDRFSGGRFQFGFGCGYLASEYEQAGIPLDPPGVRLARCAEALHIVKTYFQQEQVSFTGNYYQVKGLKASVKPLQKPYPPIYMGGGGRRVLSLAAREADIVGLVARNNARGLDWSTALPAANREKLTWIREAAGERFSHLELSATIFIAVPSDHPGAVAQQLGGRLGLSAQQTLDCMQILVGSVDQMVDELQKRRELFGISCIEVTEAHMEALAPVVARLAGR